MGYLLKAFLFGLVIYYIFKSIMLVMARIVGNGGPKPPDTHYQMRREGDINIDYQPGKGSRKSKHTEGDYIDYEEIK